MYYVGGQPTFVPPDGWVKLSFPCHLCKVYTLLMH